MKQRPKDGEIVQSEVHLERMPEIFNREAYRDSDGVVTFFRRNQQITVGIPGMTVRFSDHEYATLVELIQMWHEMGRPADGNIYNPERSLSLSEFTDNLYDGDRKFRTGKRYRERVGQWMMNLLTIPLVRKRVIADPNGDERIRMESFTFLTSIEGVMVKNGRYFDLSKVKLHKVLVDSLLSHDMKPVRLDVVRTMKSNNDVLVYRELDLILSRRNNFTKPLIQFCNELRMVYSHPRSYPAKMKIVCQSITGKELSSGGIIESCGVQKRGSDWFIFAIKGKKKALDLQSPTAPKPEVVRPQTPDEVSFADHRIKLQNSYEQFSIEEKQQVGEIHQKLLTVAPFKTNRMTIDDCFFRAVEHVLRQNAAHKRIYSVARDSGTGVEYGVEKPAEAPAPIEPPLVVPDPETPHP